MTAIMWGPGLSIVLRGLPNLILTPALASSLPTIIARYLPPSNITDMFLDLPTPIRALLSYIAFVLTRKAVRRYSYYRDMRRFGPDVVETPKIKMRWPWNADWIPFYIEDHKTNYCAGRWIPFMETYGNTMNLEVLGSTEIFTTEPENIKAILSTEFANFEKGSGFQDIVFSVLGKGIFNSNGELWKFHRTMTRPYFSRDRISHFDNFARHSDKAISKLLSRLSESNSPPVDFQDVVARFTLDSATEFLFGRDVCSLDAALPYPHVPLADDSASFAAAFGRAQDLVVTRAALALFWPYAEMFWDRTKSDMDVINAYVQPILKEKLEEKKRKGVEGKSMAEKPSDALEDGPDTLLDHLVQFTDDEITIRDEIINILVAGRDTTATALTFAVYLLSTSPDVLAKLRTEIFTRVGSTGHPTPDDFREMKYLRAVINETLRLFPAVPSNERTAIKSTVFKSGGKTYYIPKGAHCSYSVLHMHRRKDLWGPDADEFDPERWIDDRLKKYITPNPFIFLPFNAGPRICLGQQFAYNETSFFLVRLLQRVGSIGLAPEAHPEGTLPPKEWQKGVGRKVFEKVWPKSHLTLYCNGGLWVRMKELTSAGP